jgi:glyoxylase-like metal-dependent hydrolase (beta-lactamase superfamily II)
MRIGVSRLQAVVELERVAYPAAMLLTGLTDEILARERGWLAPDHIDPQSGEALLSHHAWLLDAGRRKILIDPCVGNHKSRKVFAQYDQLDTDWIDRLARAGAAPEEIDFVFCTHLHVDHCGWNTRLEDGRWVPTVPNARYVFSQAERDYWGREATGEPAPGAFNDGVFIDSVQPVIEAGLAMVVEGAVELAGCLRILPAPGHTPGHLCATLESAGEGVVFTGDAIHHPLQVLYPDWDVGAPTDAAEARRTRRRLLAQAADHGFLFAPAHFRGAHACKVARAGEGFTLDWAQG